MPFSALLLAPLLAATPVPSGLPGGNGLDASGPVAGAEPAFQVRIEQQTTIRVAPRASRMPLPPSMFLDLPERPMEPRYLERKIGKCLPISGIAGVQAEGRDRLILFMRDRRIVSAALERACRSRDFYSGFYIAPTADGQLCVDRDTLLSRSGANCKLTRIRQMVFLDD